MVVRENGFEDFIPKCSECLGSLDPRPRICAVIDRSTPHARETFNARRARGPERASTRGYEARVDRSVGRALASTNDPLLPIKSDLWLDVVVNVAPAHMRGMTLNSLPNLLTTDEVAEYLGVPKRTLEQWRVKKDEYLDL